MVWAACSGLDPAPEPASPPSGPEEIPGPTALTFPSSITIDVTSTSTGELGALTVNKDFLGSCGELCQEIAMGSNVAHFIEGFADRLFSDSGILGNVEVEVSPLITKLVTTVPLGSVLFSGASLKIDFSPFVSAQEETASCSGSTTGSPVCFRVWVADKRLIAGFFTTLATETQNGSGHIWFRPTLEFFGGGEHPPDEQSFSMGLTWDHTDPALKTTELSFGGSLTESTLAESGHAVLTQEGAKEASSIKTVKMGVQWGSFEQFGGGAMNYIGRFREDDVFWSGRVDFNFGSFSRQHSDLCVNRLTGNLVADTSCSAIETRGEEFLGPSKESDFRYPTGFPSSPPF